MGVRSRGGGDRAETDLDNIFYTAHQSGGKMASRRKKGRRSTMKKRLGGSDLKTNPEADFDSIFGKEVVVSGGRRRHPKRGVRVSKKSRLTRGRRSLKRGGHSWSNVGVDRVRRSLQSGKIVETGRLKDYNVFDGAY